MGGLSFALVFSLEVSNRFHLMKYHPLRLSLAILLGAGGVALWLTSRSGSSGMADGGESICPAVSSREGVLPMQAGPAVSAPRVVGQGTEAQVSFVTWSERFLSAPAEEKKSLVAEGVALATARRPVFRELIKTDPASALRTAVPMVVRQKLPPEIVGLLEERVSDRGTVRVYQGVGPGNSGPMETVRMVELASGKNYQTYVYGRRAEVVTWTADTSVVGVAIDTDLALDEAPLRVLELGEIPDAGKPAIAVCPVSGKTTLDTEEEAPEVITEATPAVEAYGEIVYLCDGSHVTVYRQQLISAEGRTGGPQTFTGILPAAPTPSIGNIKVLIIPMTFNDQNDTPSSESALANVMREVGDHYAKASYGKLTLVSAVTPPVKLPHNEAWYIQKDSSNGGPIDGLGKEHADARAAARAIGFDDEEYDCIVVRLKGGARPAGGWGGGRSVWIYGDGASVTAHEVGHSFGLAHANFWDTAGTSAIGSGANEEYGGHWDVMGGIGLPTGHYNVQGKNQIKWLPNDYVTEITSSGLYRIFAQDQAILDPAQRYALKIRKDENRTYWGELRGLWTGDTSRPWADLGLILGWRYPGAGGSNWQLIDTTPGSPFGKDDSPISVGRTFSDEQAGIHLTTLGVTPATATTPKSVEVQVHMGAFPGNRPPTLALTTPNVVVPKDVPVVFTATAADLDGDTLAYSWQHFGDTTYKNAGVNAPTMTRTFATSGSYVVTCIVSDQKGGTATRNLLITVGSGGSRFTLSGRVTRGGAGLAQVVMFANAANGVLTDSDGYYVIPNLPAATYSITAQLYGYSFTDLFNNGITVAPSFAGANFEAAAVPRVTISAPVATASEANATPAQILLTRTGDVSQPLVVNVTAPTGTATLTSDYTLTPALVAGSGGFSTVSFLAGEGSLTLNVLAVNDTGAEGPESVLFTLASGNGYLIDGTAATSVTIDDNDTALPKVSLRLAETKTTEGSPTPSVITFTRTGNTAAALSVSYSLSGSAVNGTDYAMLAGSFSIPAGQASGTLSLTTTDDAVAEPVETILLTATADAAYVLEPTASVVTLSLVDNDIQRLTLSVPDAVATERNLSVVGTAADTATFLITRSGSTASPLTVYYALSGTTSGTMATALHGVDYDLLPGVLTIPAGQASGSVTITPRFDRLGEAPESVTLQLGAGPTEYQLGAQNTASILINDAGDPAYVEVLGIDNGVEGASPTLGRFRFSLKGSSATPVIVNYTISGTATSGVDFTALAGSVSIPGSGTNVVEVAVTPLDDALAEELETITLTITPTPASYEIFGPSSSATIYLYDDERPTVFVDASDSETLPTIAENSAGGPFYVTRTGSTAAALVVNYTMGGTATAGTDYAAVTGTVTIPAGVGGAEVVITPTNDALAEGTETIILTLGVGAYARGQTSATFYLSDDELPATSVAFASAAAVGIENVSPAVIPVTLSAASATPVTVEYSIDAGTRSTTSSTGFAPAVLPYWVRCERIGTVVNGLVSPDGVTWTLVSSQTLPLPSASYLAGLHVCSYNTTGLCTAIFDNVSVTGLSAGGTQGARTAAGIGTTAPAGNFTETTGTYTVQGGGDNVTGTTDQGHFVYWPITNSVNCTITARVISQTNSNSAATAGVMIRETTTNNVRRGYTATTPPGVIEYHYRATAAGQDVAVTATGTATPLWVRLQRVGSAFSGFQSSNGTSWTQVGANQTLPFGAEVLVGLAASSQVEGTVATASADSLSLTPGPLPALVGRTVGLSAIQGVDVTAGGVTTISASGDGFNGTGDDGHFVQAPVSGDFVFTARLLTASGSASPQIGLMAREVTTRRARMIFMGGKPGTAPNLTWRSVTTTTAFGVGIDYTLPEGLLTFAPGVMTQNITFPIIDDLLPESDETITLVLRNANGARIGTIGQFTYGITDNDDPPALPFVGFAALTGTTLESIGTEQIPVTLSATSLTPVTVGYAITAGTATGGTDFTLATGTLTFTPGSTVTFLPVSVVNDTALESAETIILTLSGPAGAALGSQSAHTLTVTDDDAPIVTLTSADLISSETGDPASLVLTRTGPTTAALAVTLTLAGTATAGTDYTGLTTSATIPAGAASVTLTLTPVQDAALEGTETAIVTIAAGSGYAVGPQSTLTLSVLDDDRNTVTLTATTPTAVEGGASGLFTVTRTGVLTAALTVNLTVSGTATATTDYTTNPASVTALVFAANQATRTISVLPVNDTLTEGDEVVLIQVAAGTYDIVGAGFASVRLQDNDIPPTVFIDSPGAQGVVIAPGQGVKLHAVMEDDGLPQVVQGTWSLVSGPSAVIFDPISSTTGHTSATFGMAGTYVVKVSATDSQFTVSDQIAVNVGGTAALAPAEWLTSDVGPPTARGTAGQTGNAFTLRGAGVGYATNSDRAMTMARQISGDGTITARLTAVTQASGLTTAEAGLVVRDSLHRYSRRAGLLYTPSTQTLRFRPRVTNNTADTPVAITGLSLPLWLRIQRTDATDTMTAQYAPDISGVPGAWITVGAATIIAMDSMADYSLTALSGSETALAAATFDSVALTPAPAAGSPATLIEDFGDTTQNGTYSFAAGIHTLNGQPGGVDSKAQFWGQQVTGDFILTALQLTATSGADSAMSGIMVRDSMDDGPMAFVGRNPFGAYSSFIWRTNSKGSTDGLNGITQTKRWLRFIRRGSQLTALHAADVNGSVPTSWTQMGQPQSVFLTPTVLCGLAVCNGAGVGFNTATFSNLTVVPINAAPIIGFGTLPASPSSPLPVVGLITDDGLPAAFTSAWSAVAPSVASFASPSALSTTATFSTVGAYTFRLCADDTMATTFRDLNFTSASPVTTWQTLHFGSTAAPSAQLAADPDQDGVPNILEYAFGLNPLITSSLPPLNPATTPTGLRFTIPRNPAATDVSLVLEYNDTLSATWSSTGLIDESVNASQLIIRDPAAPVTPQRRFYHVRIVGP
jgi:regulation of enolase protein 1 (concanavalin A-like superfamily)